MQRWMPEPTTCKESISVSKRSRRRNQKRSWTLCRRPGGRPISWTFAQVFESPPDRRSPWRCIAVSTRLEPVLPGPLRRNRMPPMIQIRHLRKQYKELVALKDLNLDLEAGDFFGYIGPNGAGKTTTIKMLATLLTP